MQKGFSLLLVLILVVFLALPAGFLVYSMKSSSPSVKGVNVQGHDNGIYVVVNSDSETWDLVQYLCESKDACLKSLQAGTRAETISGGKAQNFGVVIEPTSQWDSFQYLKLFVKSGWGSSSKTFLVKSLGDVPGSTIQRVSDGETGYDAVLLPINTIKKQFYTSAEFSDLQ